MEALIVAAGRGARAGGFIPKQYRPLRGRTVLERAICAMLEAPQIEALRVVIHPDDAERYREAVAGIDDPRLMPPVRGGATRAQSVANGLAQCTRETVLIHDGARPLLPLDALARLIAALHEHQAATLALPVTDALWHGADGRALHPQPRAGLWRAQTPQGFRLADIRAAHAAAAGAEAETAPADDVEIARAAGIEVALVEGSERNIKITRPEDFALARELLGGPMDIRTGQGFDVHAFTEGDHVILNGVRIPHARALAGHSDADVAMHAVTDAILGALCAGDIGQHFPPSDPQWKGAASRLFLEHAARLAQERGYAITHVDSTIIAEAPKIGPHALAMRENLAEIIGIPVSHVSVKATTSERLGFTGRGEGIAAMASATLVAL